MATATSRHSVVRPKPFSVDHFRKYARQLVLDSGEPFEPEDWQLGFVEDLFDGVQQVWLVVPQANGKTTFMAVVALYHCDFTPSPWVPVAAAAARQARVLYESAAGFVERTPVLQKRFLPQGGYLRVLSLVNGGWGIQVYSADRDTGQGIQPTFCLVDEAHVQKDLGLYRAWRGKLRKRNAQIALISTAGEPGTDFETTRDAVRAAATEREQLGRCQWRFGGPRIVMHEFRVDSPEQVRDLDIVKAANPLSTVTKAGLAELLEDPTLDWGEDWLRQTCNIPARSSKAAVSEADWDRAYTDERIPEGVPIRLGADFAWSHDTTALVPMWVRDNEFRLLGEPAVLVPPRDGTMLSPQEIKDAFDEIHERNPVEVCVADKTKAQDTLLWMENERGVHVIDRQQGPKAEAQEYEAFMEALRGGGSADDRTERESWLRHTGDRTLRSHVMNAIARKLPGDRFAFDRPSSSRHASKQDHRVIDALKAAAMVNIEASQMAGSVYAERGMLAI